MFMPCRNSAVFPVSHSFQMKIKILPRKNILTICILLLTLNALMAQRPKVGLVLSGGGAKGISHIGILQAIDSAGLKIDYISGTSMGSIIGGLVCHRLLRKRN